VPCSLTFSEACLYAATRPASGSPSSSALARASLRHGADLPHSAWGRADTVGYRTVSEGCDRVASLALAVRDYFQCRSPLGSLHVVRALLPGVLVSYNPIFPGQEGFSRIYSVFIRPLMKGAG
jgi:hypothetical protein